MSKDNNLGRMIVGIIGGVIGLSLLTSAAFFSFYKAFNEVLDTLINDILKFLLHYGIALSVTGFWLILGVSFLILAIIFISSGD